VFLKNVLEKCVCQTRGKEHTLDFRAGRALLEAGNKEAGSKPTSVSQSG